MRIAACVLAAGASRRMGTPKALLESEGQTFVDLLLDSFRAANVEPRFVVVRSASSPIRAACRANGARLLVNPDPDRGMLSSLHVCLRDILESTAHAPRIEGLFVAPVDCPRVRPETIARLVQEFERSGAAIVVPRHATRRGHPTLFAATLFEELLCAPLDLGARAVVWAHASDRLEVPVQDAAVLDDVDTPAAAERIARPEDPSKGERGSL